MIAEQVRATPDALALVYGDTQLSYGELDARANQLAHWLQAQGVGPDVPVAVCAERSVELVVALLGVIKAGGAYLPLDPDHPRERLQGMLADSGSPFRQSVLLNVGARDGIQDGWATMDGIGLVGRISGVGSRTSRVILLTDSSSHIPVLIQPSGQKAILAGDNSMLPPLEFVEHPDEIQPGDRVISTGDGNVFPAGLLVGQVALGADKRLRVVLAADYERLEFLRVLRSYASAPITDTGALLVPLPPRALPPGVQGPLMPAAGLPVAVPAESTLDGAVSPAISDGTTGARSD